MNDIELTDAEHAFAQSVRVLLRQQLSDAFWSYIRTLTMTFRHDMPDEVQLHLAFELFLPQLDDGFNLEFSTLLINNPRMAEVVARTSVSHLEDMLRIYARETGQEVLYEVARLVRR